jgi:porphobilinogen synthase
VKENSVKTASERNRQPKAQSEGQSEGHSSAQKTSSKQAGRSDLQGGEPDRAPFAESDNILLHRVRMTHRPRRNRRTAALRDLIRETRVHPSDFILPLFVAEGHQQRIAISSMPGQFRLSVDQVLNTCREAIDLGVSAVALFPVLAETKKDRLARESLNPDGLFQEAISEIKAKFPEMVVIGDVAMDPYSSDGHDGLVHEDEIVNDPTLEILAQMAVAQARAGVDAVAPSDMMDGRVGYIRRALDRAGFEHVSIMAYAAKYASAFYGPFREALDSAPKAGDKKTYQMDPGNRREAIREVLLDCQEGADIVMVKPALAYLDVIAAIRAKVSVPVAAYQVSGEYAMIKAAAKNGWIDGEKAMAETLLSIKRAGADMILTYFALEMARLL